MNQGENPNRSYLADQPIPVILRATILFLSKSWDFFHL